MDLGDTRGKLIAGAIVLAALGLLYFIWVRMNPPAPAVPQGQSLSNPFGGNMRAGGTPAPASTPVQPVAGAPAGRMDVPPAGTYDPVRGFGPSRPIPGQRR